MTQRTHKKREDTKYGNLIHDGAFEADDDAEVEDEQRVSDHHVEIHWDDGSGRGRRFDVHLSHGHDWTPLATLVYEMRWKGSYWRRGQQIDWADVPVPVRQRVAEIVARSSTRNSRSMEVTTMRSDQPSLDPGLERTLEREYKYQKYESMRRRVLRRPGRRRPVGGATEMNVDTEVDPNRADELVRELEGLMTAAEPALDDAEMESVADAIDFIEDVASIETGKVLMTSEMTDTTYRVTRWVKLSEEQIIALNKREVDDGE